MQDIGAEVGGAAGRRASCHGQPGGCGGGVPGLQEHEHAGAAHQAGALPCIGVVLERTCLYVRGNVG